MSFDIRQLSVVSCQLQNENNGQLTKDKGQNGFSLLELIITLSVLAILVMGTIPLSQNAIKRQKELRLRESLTMLRGAIDEFKRDTVGACTQGATSSRNPLDNTQNLPADPRSRVVIDDCEIFDTLNLDRYPPSLEILVEGVKVKSRGPNTSLGGGVFNGNATQTNENKEVTKIYLREIPIDPMTGEKDWKLQSSYQPKGEAWDGVNVFDVRSSSEEEAFNGEKYSNW
jgi:general secretion pathway protein G